MGVSGYSGEGAKPSPKNNIENLINNLIPYSLTDHIHEKEISSQLGKEVTFIPHVDVWFQVIYHSINIPLKDPYITRYTEFVPGTIRRRASGQSRRSGKRVVVNVTIDDLLKGAATQALQNMNLALDYAEFEGVPLKAASSGVT
ncbi:hypothetical protein ABVK25_004713 [Lepraria finkii]|uniref:N-acetyl-gamma-glutamyl-phosphate reductase dimerisation domain-containing protein n=1 Tax=Lepraria finkii TaxID=1340010 RepID=A0ABR4BCX0_9LECA